MSKLINAFLLIVSFAGLLQSLEAAERVNRADDDEGDANSVSFVSSLETVLIRRGLKAADFCDQSDEVSRRILKEYGAVFLADDGLLVPPVCIFTNAQAVSVFQSQMRVSRAEIGSVRIELQSEALNALLAARREAMAANLDITPRGGIEAARRDYEDTVRLWNSRTFPALAHWYKAGRLMRFETKLLPLLPVREQITLVLKNEESGIFFSRDFSKSILYSVAAPGASQHLSLLAFDVNEYGNGKVRRILARHGWFRTVRNDEPHFTFLGLEEKDLPSKGLIKLRSKKSGEYWIPNL